MTGDLPGVCSGCAESIPWITKVRCLRCGRAIGCPDCSRTGVNEWAFVLNRSAVMYNEQMREWLAQYKYRGNERYAELLSLMLVRSYTQLEWELRDLMRSMDHPSRITPHRMIHAVTSVPVSEARLQERGFNQAESMAQLLAQQVNLPYGRLLRRLRHTDKQSFKTRMERLKDMEGAFGTERDAINMLSRHLSTKESHWRRKQFMAKERDGLPLRILLVDDIYTTGSTVHACAQVLRNHEADLGRSIEVYCLTWARS